MTTPDGGTTFSAIQDFLGKLATSQTGEVVASTDVSADYATAAFTSTQAAAAATQAQTTGLQSAIDGSTAAGKSFSDLFERTSTTDLGGNWLINYSGAGSATLATANGHDAALVPGSGVRRANAFYIPATGGAVWGETVTDYQKVTISNASYPDIGSSSTTGAINYIYGRANSTGTSFVYAKITRRYTAPYLYTFHVDIELGCVVSGTPTVFATVTDIQAAPAYSLICGSDGVTPRKFRVISSVGSILLDYTEAGTTSQLGAGFQNVGFGFETVSVGGSQLQPSRVAAWTAVDYTPTPVNGSGALISRTSTSNASNALPTTTPLGIGGSGAWDTVEFSTSDVAPIANGSGSFFVYQPGWYQVQAQVLLSGAANITSSGCSVNCTDPGGTPYTRTYNGPVLGSVSRIALSFLVYVPYGGTSAHAATVKIGVVSGTASIFMKGPATDTWSSCSRVSP